MNDCYNSSNGQRQGILMAPKKLGLPKALVMELILVLSRTVQICTLPKEILEIELNLKFF